MKKKHLWIGAILGLLGLGVGTILLFRPKRSGIKGRDFLIFNLYREGDEFNDTLNRQILEEVITDLKEKKSNFYSIRGDLDNISMIYPEYFDSLEKAINENPNDLLFIIYKNQLNLDKVVPLPADSGIIVDTLSKSFR